MRWCNEFGISYPYPTTNSTHSPQYLADNPLLAAYHKDSTGLYVCEECGTIADHDVANRSATSGSVAMLGVCVSRFWCMVESHQSHLLSRAELTHEHNTASLSFSVGGEFVGCWTVPGLNSGGSGQRTFG